MTARMTRLLADIIADDFLKTGGGNLNPTLDELAIAWQAESGIRLADALDFVNRRMGRALDLLAEDGWPVWVPYTGTFQARGFVEPDDTDWPMLLACVAGQGHAASTIGYHFHVPGTEACWMWMVWRDFYDKVANGARAATTENIAQAIDHAGQPPEVLAGLTATRLAAVKVQVRAMKQLVEK